MKKALLLFSVACFVLLNSSLIYAMDHVSQEVTRSLIATIQPKYANDLITFVKQISHEYLVVFDRKGRGEMFTATDDHKSVRTLGGTVGKSILNIFAYEDRQGEQLLIAVVYSPVPECNKVLYVWNLNENKWAETLYVGHDFSLYQKAHNTLVMVNKYEVCEERWVEKHEPALIDLEWKMVKEQYKFPKTVLFKSIPLEQKSLETLLVKDEGFIAHPNSLNITRELSVDGDTFYMPARGGEHWRYIDGTVYLDDNFVRECPARVICYHSVPTGVLLLGHDRLITIWSAPKKIIINPHQVKKIALKFYDLELFKR